MDTYIYSCCLRKFGIFQSDAVILQIGTHDLTQPTNTSAALRRNPNYAVRPSLLASEELITNYTLAFLVNLSVKRLHRQLKRYWIFAVAGFILMLLLLIPIRLAIAHYQAPHPQAILTLGGGIDREQFTAQFAQTHPSLEIWVSSGISPNNAREIFGAAGISDQRVHLDYHAIDTVTNFTSLVQDFKSQNLQHLYLITSDFHMPRAKAIATIVLGSQGITFTPISIPSNEPTESLVEILRDSCRAILWVFTGRTGASLSPRVAHSYKCV